MENRDVYTPEQESWIEGKYGEFYAAIEDNNVNRVREIIDEMNSREFYLVASDMVKEFATKRLYV